MRRRDERDFHKLWAGTLVSDIGSQITLFALPVMAVSTLAVSGRQIGLLQACYTLPFLLMPIPAGVWLERRPLRPVLIAGNLVCAALVLSIPVADVLGRLRLSQLFAVAALGGAATIVCDITQTSFVPRIVVADRLAAANSRLAIGLAVGVTAGPGLAGVLSAVGGPSFALTMDGATYLCCAAALAGIRHRDRPPDDLVTGRSVGAEVRAGLRTVFGTPSVRAIAIHTALFNGGIQVVSVAIVVYFIRDLAYGSAAYGIVLLGGGAGAVLGSLAAPALIRRLGYGWTLLAMMGVTVNAFWVVPAAHGAPATVIALCAVALAVGLTGSGAAGVVAVTVRQLVTPKTLHAKMNASYQLVNFSAIPLGAIASGILVDRVGARDTLWIAAAVLVVSVTPLTHRAVRSLGKVLTPPTTDPAALPTAPD